MLKNIQEKKQQENQSQDQEVLPDIKRQKATSILNKFIKDSHIPDDLDKKYIYKDIVQIAWPSLVELLLTQLATMVDLMMVGQLGPWALTSVGLTTQPKFLLLAVFIAFNTGATALVARFKGAGDRVSANNVLRQALLVTFFASIAVSVAGYFLAEPLIKFMGAGEEATLVGGTKYLQVQMIGFTFSALTLSVTGTLRGAGETRISMIYNVIANVVNVIFNYLLIYGHLGFPRLEVAGASIATVIGQAVAFIIAFMTILRGRGYLHLDIKSRFYIDRTILKRIVNIGTPAMGEQLIMRTGMLIFSKVVASLGTVGFAAHQICMSIQALSFMNGQAFSISATSLMGQSLGKKRVDYASAYVSRTRRLGMAFSVIIALVCFFLGGPIISLYNDDPEIIRQGALVLKVVALMQPLQSSQLILAGALRGAGDTASVAKVTLITIILVRPVLAIFFVIFFHWGLMGAWLAMIADQVVRSFLVMKIYNKGRWKTLNV